MEKFSEMIKRLCPEGVEKVKLNSLCVSISTGLNPRTNFKLNEDGAMLNYVTVKEIATNKIVFSDSTDKISDKAKAIINKRSRLEKGDILFSGIGTIGKVVYVDIETDNWDCSESVFLLKPNELVYGKFLSYTLISRAVISQYESCAAGAIMKGVRKVTLENLDIPLPPLSIQQEIVRILDSFTSMITNLETELASRQKQYEYYRNKLLTFDENDESVEWKTLGDVCLVTKLAGYEFTEHVTYSDKGNIIALRGLNVKNGKLDLSDVKFIDDSNFSKLNRSKLFVGDMLFTYVGTVGQVALVNENDKFYLAPNVALVRINAKGNLMPDYLNYVCQSDSFQTKGINKFCASSSMKNISMANIRKMSIPIPSLERQQEIVSTLDTFESLITNIKQELEARKKQYEYYREQLLTFE